MRPDDPMRRSGARWCEQHDRWECAAQRKGGQGHCHGPAIAGTDRCRMHAGKSAELAKAQGEALLTAWSVDPAADVVVDPGQAVLGMLQMSWLRASLYAQLLEAQVDAQGGTPGDVDDLAGGDGSAAGGLIGHTYGAVKDIGVYATGEATRGLAALEAQERDRVVRFAKTAHDMGIAEAQIRLAEQQGQLLASGMSWLLARAAEQLAWSESDVGVVRGLVGEMLRHLAAGQVPALETGGRA